MLRGPGSDRVHRAPVGVNEKSSELLTPLEVILIVPGCHLTGEVVRELKDSDNFSRVVQNPFGLLVKEFASLRRVDFKVRLAVFQNGLLNVFDSHAVAD